MHATPREADSVKKDAFYILSEKKKLQVAPYNRSFESRSLWQRFLTIFGGPAMNFVLAFFIFLIVASIQGKPVNSNVIGQIVPNNPANFASIVSGDKIISIDGVAVDNWTTIGQALNDSMGEENLSLVIERNGQLITLSVNPRIDINAMGISNYYKEKIGGNDIYGEIGRAHV